MYKCRLICMYVYTKFIYEAWCVMCLFIRTYKFMNDCYQSILSLAWSHQLIHFSRDTWEGVLPLIHFLHVVHMSDQYLSMPLLFGHPMSKQTWQQELNSSAHKAAHLSSSTSLATSSIMVSSMYANQMKLAILRIEKNKCSDVYEIMSNLLLQHIHQITLSTQDHLNKFISLLARLSCYCYWFLPYCGTHCWNSC